MKIGLFADGIWGENTLKELLIMDVRISFVALRWKPNQSNLEYICRDKGIPVLQEEDINADHVLKIIKIFGCNIFISMSFDQIFKEPLLTMAPLGAINCHAGKLPSYRGRSVLNWALINGESEFGITVHFMDCAIDTGDIVIQKVFPIYPSDNFKTLLETAYVQCAKCVRLAVEIILSGEVKRIEQPKNGSTVFYCRRRVVGDERVDWRWSSERIHNFVRALVPPGPGALTTIHGKNLVLYKTKIAGASDVTSSQPGTVSAVDIANEQIVVITGRGSLAIEEFKCGITIKKGDLLV